MQTSLAILLSLGLGLSVLPNKLPRDTATSFTPNSRTTSTEVILLGTGTPYPDPAASGLEVSINIRKPCFSSGIIESLKDKPITNRINISDA